MIIFFPLLFIYSIVLFVFFWDGSLLIFHPIFVKFLTCWSSFVIDYRLSVCGPPKICTLKPNPQWNGISNWGLWEMIRSWRGNAMKIISALIKDTPESFLSYSNTGRGCNKKTSICELGSNSHQILNLPTPWSWTS